MKKLLLILLFAGCKNETKHIPQPPDTTYPIIIYHGQDGMQYGVWRRVMVDSFTFVDSDSTHKVKRWTRVPVYYVPATDSATRKVVYYQVRPEYLIADMNVDTDSLAKIKK